MPIAVIRHCNKQQRGTIVLGAAICLQGKRQPSRHASKHRAISLRIARIALLVTLSSLTPNVCASCSANSDSNSLADRVCFSSFFGSFSFCCNDNFHFWSSAIKAFSFVSNRLAWITAIGSLASWWIPDFAFWCCI